MTDREAYFEQAQSWAADTQAISARSRRIAWTVAGIAVAVAAFEALALAMLAPLKTVQPVTLLVDKHTGYVQALDPSSPRRVTADDALTNSMLAQYVAAREGFDRSTVSLDYRRVALWSGGPARQGYLAAMPAANPASPFNLYKPGTSVLARVKSISRLSQGVALVRFDTQVSGRDGRSDPTQPWIAVVHYRYSDAPMRFEDRLVNPLGFQVLTYRRDAEAPPMPSGQSATGSNVPIALTRRTTFYPSPSAVPEPRQQRSKSTQPGAVEREMLHPSIGVVERREVPLNNLPMGSPLSPGGMLPTQVAIGTAR